MAGIRELRVRIRSVGNIKQITRAMEMVATTKLRRFQDRALASRPYTTEITQLVGHLAERLGEATLDRPLFKAGQGDKTALLLVSSDRGLCGAYNSNVFRELELWIRARQGGGLGTATCHLYVIGRKGYQYASKRGFHVERYLSEPPLEQMDFQSAARIARILTQSFLTGQYKEVRVLYTAFESVVRYVPRWIPLLPVSASALAGAEAANNASNNNASNKVAPTAAKHALTGDVILEPDANSIFDSLVPRYLETKVFNALLESLTSEYASRRVSMKNATDAARDMQGELKMVYNRKRQETITKELLDIVGGAEALR
jgi:F-type H+-transporting ATPase subunit gamma